MNDLSFGSWLKRRRRGLGLTQNELGRRAGYSGETIRKVEADALRPSQQMAAQLADQLAIAPAERASFIHFARDEPEGDAALPSLPSALPQRRASLPIQLTELIGRETEPAQLRQLLLNESVRLVSLLGPPGIGKTRLALHTAAQLEPEFADGVCFVALSPLHEPGLVAGELAQALGVQEAGGQLLSDRLKSYLHPRQMLLVLDNFEHVLAAAALVAELLAGCPGIKVLVTSRAALHLAGEQQFEVPALALPSLAPLPPLDSLARCAAVALYVQRTQAIKPSFQLTADNAAAVAAICVQLDGLPLAIELAAARSKLFSPAALLARLDQRLDLLTGVARDRPARQQTLRGLIDWSYNLLAPAAQTLFARLAVFAGGCTLEAAETVCGDAVAAPDDLMAATGDLQPAAVADDRLKLDGWLGVLIDQSLVRQSENPGREPRYWMLETLREYALERLAESREAETLRRRHAAFYLALAEQAAVESHGSQQGRWLDRLAADHDNFRAALAWSISPAGELELGLRLAKRLGSFWNIRAYYMEGQKWLDELLRRSHDRLSVDRVECMLVASNLMWRKYDYAGQLSMAHAAVVLARQLGRPRQISIALCALASPLTTRGEHAAARALAQESLALAIGIGDVQAEATALRALALVASNEGDFGVASEYTQQALRYEHNSGSRATEADCYYRLGTDAWLQGQYASASEHFNQALQLFLELGHVHLVGVIYWGLGCVALDQGELDRAREHFQQCLSCFREIDFRVGYCGYLLGMAGIATARGQALAAVRLTSAAGALRAALGHQLDPCLVPRFVRQLARARTQLDEGAFAAAWAAGQGLSPEAAVAEAQAQVVAEV